jgi:Cas3 C-terminal domain
MEERSKDWNLACSRLFFSPIPPSNDDRFGDAFADLEDEEDSDAHRHLLAQTRLGDPSADVVCLWAHGEKLTLDAAGTCVVDVNNIECSAAELRVLLEHSVKLLEHQLPNDESCFQPPAWKKHAVLRAKRLLVLRAEATTKVFFNEELGLVLGQLAKELR